MAKYRDGERTSHAHADKDKDKDKDRASDYGDELLCANWNPVIELLAWSCGKTLDDVSRKSKLEMTDSDIDTFLCRIYTLGA